MIFALDHKYENICTLIKDKPELKNMTPTQFLGRIRAHEKMLLEKAIIQNQDLASRRYDTALKAKKPSLEDQSSENGTDEESDSKKRW